MSRERYLLHAEEESIHNNVITADTKKEKAQNWWYYNKKILLFSLLGGGILLSLIFSIVFQERPDYTIAVMNQGNLDYTAIEIVEKELAAYGEDLNSDGKVLVSVVNYAVSTGSEDSAYDVGAQQAAVTKFAGDMTMGESMIWLHDDIGYYCMQDQEDLFDPIEAPVSLKDPVMIPWNDVPALQKITFEDYQHEVFTPANMQEIFATLRVSIRKVEGSVIERKDALMQYQAASERLLYRLIHDIKPEETQETPVA